MVSLSPATKKQRWMTWSMPLSKISQEEFYNFYWDLQTVITAWSQTNSWWPPYPTDLKKLRNGFDDVKLCVVLSKTELTLLRKAADDMRVFKE